MTLTLETETTFAPQVFDTVQSIRGGYSGIITSIREDFAPGTAYEVTRTDNGAVAILFRHEFRLTEKYVGCASRFEISDDTAARFAAYARS